MVSSRALKCMCVVFAATVLMPAALAKDKKPAMPVYILKAHSVAVIIDPEAGRSLPDPSANETAQKDVETALLKWGRFEPVLNPEDADLVIVVRKGSGKLADVNVTEPRQNRQRDGTVTSTDGAISVGVQHGSQPRSGDVSSGQTSRSGGEPQVANPDPQLHPQAEVGNRNDSFLVYPGGSNPRNNVPGWRYSHKDALHSHDVPAVDEFRKALDAAEKQAAQQKP